MQPSLFDTDAPAGRYALWCRRSRRHKWRAVGCAETHYGAVLLIAGSGEYVVIEGGGHPNDDRATRAQPGAQDGLAATRAT